MQSLSIKTSFYETNNILYLEHQTYFHKTVSYFRSGGTLFVIVFTSAVICKQRLFHGNEIVQYLQNYKRYDVDQDHFRKPLKFYTVHEKERSLNSLYNFQSRDPPYYPKNWLIFIHQIFE